MLRPKDKNNLPLPRHKERHREHKVQKLWVGVALYLKNKKGRMTEAY